jgi:hypothetical protein
MPQAAPGDVARVYEGVARSSDLYTGPVEALGGRSAHEAPHRFTDAKARRNCAGTSPITPASGTNKLVLARYARNRRLTDAARQWAMCSMRGSPGARARC